VLFSYIIYTGLYSYRLPSYLTGRFGSIDGFLILLNKLVMLLSMNGLCYYQVPLEIVQQNVRINLE
jgi:hypothetical protein